MTPRVGRESNSGDACARDTCKVLLATRDMWTGAACDSAAPMMRGACLDSVDDSVDWERTSSRVDESDASMADDPTGRF